MRTGGKKKSGSQTPRPFRKKTGTIRGDGKKIEVQTLDSKRTRKKDSEMRESLHRLERKLVKVRDKNVSRQAQS